MATSSSLCCSRQPLTASSCVHFLSSRLTGVGHHEYFTWVQEGCWGWGTLVGDAISGLVVLGSIRKQAEQARGSKPVTSLHGLCISSCFLTCLSSSPDFLWWWQQCGSVSWINPFLLNLVLGHDFCAGIETLTKT
jgi:hypothetical protein